MPQLVAGPFTTSVLALAGDSANVDVRIEFTRVFGDTISLSSELRQFIAVTQNTEFRVYFSQDGGVTFFNRGTIDLLLPGISYVGMIQAIGQIMRFQFTATVPATTVYSRFAIR